MGTLGKCEHLGTMLPALAGPLSLDACQLRVEDEPLEIALTLLGGQLVRDKAGGEFLELMLERSKTMEKLFGLATKCNLKYAALEISVERPDPIAENTWFGPFWRRFLIFRKESANTLERLRPPSVGRLKTDSRFTERPLH